MTLNPQNNIMYSMENEVAKHFLACVLASLHLKIGRFGSDVLVKMCGWP